MHLQIMKFARVYAGKFGSVHNSVRSAHARGVRELTTKTQLIAVSLSNSTDVLASYLVSKKTITCTKIDIFFEVIIVDLVKRIL